jgi:ferredoxin
MNLHALGNIRRFSQGIVDIFSAVKPGLAVMDGVVGMDGNGPSFGTIRKTGIIAASRDGVALDAVCSSMVGYKESEILTTFEASNRGLGNGRLGDIQLIGTEARELSLSWDKVKTMPLDMVPSRLFRMMIGLVYTRPKLIKANCTRCATCASHCPAHAIRLNPYPVLDYNKCLKCFTCNEICPNGAYQLRKSFLARILGRMGIQL